MKTFSVVINTQCGLSGTDELSQGLRDLRRVVERHPGLSGWQAFDLNTPGTTLHDLIQAAKGEQVLVVLNPALIVCNQLVETMQSVLADFPDSVVAPGDPRTAHGEWQIDYASRSGFDRYVDRRAALPQARVAAENPSWLLMANRTRLLSAWANGAPPSGSDAWPDALYPQWEASRAFVHSYADYQCNDRKEMLDLIPASVQRLMDVGGGEGRFLAAFQAARGGDTLLVEPNPDSAKTAQSAGVSVLNARFESVQVAQVGVFDCISFLDVLEHLVNPLEALLHASLLLKPGGHVLISVPNVGHWSVVQDLLQGRFDYLPVGILCNTHVRFFTEPTLRQLLGDAGLEVVTWRNQPSPMPATFAEFLGGRNSDASPVNLSSMNTDSFHVLARKP